ncbi:hypothetical protein Tco_1032830 [Tanacetum coccineum]|uniref:RNA-directed DNA polymerase, eukaryota n=1 Tax=Tanacetum coccineum TaxID=301880 RepID=A0ABQ5GDS2_9ASTR
MFQKAKIRWAIEGDENTKYFHGVINKKHSQMAIRGVLVDGDWIVEPFKVKKKLNHFSNRFAEHSSPRLTLESQFSNSLSSNQQSDLERDVFYDEIKKAVWDCGINKSLGADGLPSNSFVGLYKGIPFDDSLKLSHLFYADDVMFVGIPHNKVVLAAESIVCLTFSVPFNFLGVKVGGIMSRRSSWDEVIAKLTSRLSKWKLKTLSIGGRLTLIKLVLSSLPLYHMSIFKCPMGVLKFLESIRRNFFNGVTNLDRYGALSPNALLYGLDLLKAFMVLKVLLIILKLLLDAHLGLISSKSSKASLLKVLTVSLLLKKMGNGENTSFWEDSWLTDSFLKLMYPRLSLMELDKQVTVAFKLRDTSLVSSFRRVMKGGVKEEQLRLFDNSLSHIILP